jgi:hypothetical protein
MGLGRSYGFGDGVARCTQDEEQLTGPEEYVQKAAALKIGEALGLQTYIERFAGALFHKRAHGSQVDLFGAKAAPARVDSFEFVVAAQQEVV